MTQSRLDRLTERMRAALEPDLLEVVDDSHRHAGHADIIRESIDGATMYELIAAAENREPTPWLTPWAPK